MKDRKQAAPGSLSISLSLFGLAYVTVCILAGPDPPSFLFDAIPAGIPRRVGGALLWVHVAVSYAINSQAFCSSVERVVGHKLQRCLFGPRLRWTVLTGMVAVASFLVANSIPFFKVSSCSLAYQTIAFLLKKLSQPDAFVLVLYTIHRIWSPFVVLSPAFPLR